MVQQRTSSDCLIACFCMFAMEDYDRVASFFRDEQIYLGIGFVELKHAAGKMGHTLCRRPVEKWLIDLPSILIVPSLNHEGGNHAVYWNGSECFDPSPGKTYDEVPRKIHYVIQRC